MIFLKNRKNRYLNKIKACKNLNFLFKKKIRFSISRSKKYSIYNYFNKFVTRKNFIASSFIQVYKLNKFTFTSL